MRASLRARPSTTLRANVSVIAGDHLHRHAGAAAVRYSLPRLRPERVDEADEPEESEVLELALQVLPVLGRICLNYFGRHGEHAIAARGHLFGGPEDLRSIQPGARRHDHLRRSLHVEPMLAPM